MIIRQIYPNTITGASAYFSSTEPHLESADGMTTTTVANLHHFGDQNSKNHAYA